MYRSYVPRNCIIYRRNAPPSRTLSGHDRAASGTRAQSACLKPSGDVLGRNLGIEATDRLLTRVGARERWSPWCQRWDSFPRMVGVPHLLLKRHPPNPRRARTVPRETRTISPPGARLMGVVGVHKAEIAGEVDSRSFGLKIAHAASPNAKAAVVEVQVEALDERLQRLEAQDNRYR